MQREWPCGISPEDQLKGVCTQTCLKSAGLARLAGSVFCNNTLILSHLMLNRKLLERLTLGLTLAVWVFHFALDIHDPCAHSCKPRSKQLHIHTKHSINY